MEIGRLVTLVVAVASVLSTPVPSVAFQAGDPEQWYFWTDDDVRHFVYEVGSARGVGDTVVVLHGGWGAEHSYLVGPMAGVAGEYRFVFYDQRGSLRSPAPDSTIRIGRMVADLEHLRRSLGLDQMTLAAHSMGGALAYAYLSAHPERVRGLLLMGAVHPARFSDGGPPEDLVREVWPEADLEALTARRQEFFQAYPERAWALIEAEGIVPEHLSEVPRDSAAFWEGLGDREQTRIWRIQFTAVNTCNPSRWREMEGGMAFYSQNVADQVMSDEAYEGWAAGFWPALRSFQGPVRVVAGTCDYVDLGPDLWPRFAQHLGNAAVYVVDNAGHSAWMDRPTEFAQVVRRSLDEIRRGALPSGR